MKAAANLATSENNYGSFFFLALTYPDFPRYNEVNSKDIEEEEYLRPSGVESR